MEEETRQSSTVLPTTNSFPGGVRSRTATEESHPASEDTEISGSIILRAKERLIEEASYSGLVPAKHLHPMRQVPDAQYFADPGTSSSRDIHDIYRSYRRLLAHPSFASVIPLPWVQTRVSGIRVQSDALRPQYSSKGLHEADGHNGSTTSNQGNTSGSLPRRLVSLGKDKGSVRASNKGSHSLPSTVGVADQLQKVATHTTTKIPMARHRLEYGKVHTDHAKIKAQTDVAIGKAASCKQQYVKTPTGESDGVSTVHGKHRPSSKGQTQRYQQSLANKSKCEAEGPGLKDSSRIEESTQTMDNDQESLKDSKIVPSASVSDSSYGCFKNRVGGSLNLQGSPRKVVKELPGVSYQSSGGHGSFSSIEEAQSEERLPHSGNGGQLDSSPQHQQVRLEVSSDQSCHHSHSLTGKEKGMVPERSTPRRGQECSGRCTIKRQSQGNRMVPGRKVILFHIEENTEVADRFVRNEQQPKTSPLRFTKCGPKGCRDGRPVSRLEQMESHIPISSDQSTTQSSPEAENIQRDSSISSTQVAQEPMVSSGPGTQPTFDPNPGTSAVPGGTERDCLCQLLSDKPPSFNDFVQFAMNKRLGIQRANAEFVKHSLSDSTQNQYGSVWNKWIKFVQKHKPTQINMDFCLSFIRDLFDEGLASTTINSYKSALTQPVKFGFNIDLDSDIFNRAVKAAGRQRPAPPPKPITWSLGKVLELASQINNQEANRDVILQKSLFLLAMASGARLSELVALSRDSGHIVFKDNGEALLYPDPTFLAKNELPTDRWDPWCIPPLTEDESLCPVAALKAYMAATGTCSSGQLFRIGDQNKNMTIKQLRAKILYFIKRGDPDSVPQGHDVRKVATTINYFQYMSFQDLKSYTGWKSPKVFYKHYLKQIGAVARCVIAAGKKVNPVHRRQ